MQNNLPRATLRKICSIASHNSLSFSESQNFQIGWTENKYPFAANLCFKLLQSQFHKQTKNSATLKRWTEESSVSESFLLTVKEALSKLLWERVGSVLVRRKESAIWKKWTHVKQIHTVCVLCRPHIHSFYYTTDNFLFARDRLWDRQTFKSLTFNICSRQAKILPRSISNPNP